MNDEKIIDPEAFVSALCSSDLRAPELRQDDAYDFAKQLFKTLNICTAANVKLCKSFIFRNITVSGQRTDVLANYLVTLSKYFAPKETRSDITEPDGIEHEGLQSIFKGLKMQQPPDPAFLRLHVLYIVNDVLCFLYTHSRQRNTRLSNHFEAVDSRLKPRVAVLAQLAALGGGLPDVLDLIDNWKRLSVFSLAEIESLQDKSRTAADLSWQSLLARCSSISGSAQGRLQDNSPKWTIPPQHSVINDPYAPWNELPAANGLYMKRTRGYPLQHRAMPFGGYQIRGAGQQADVQLQEDVEWLYDEVLHCFDKQTNPDDVSDIDPLGNIMWKDPERQTRNYWGFTIDGMKKRKDLGDQFAKSASGYDDLNARVPGFNGQASVDVAIERAKALAAANRGGGRGHGRGRGYGRGGGNHRGRGFQGGGF